VIDDAEGLEVITSTGVVGESTLEAYELAKTWLEDPDTA